MDSEATITLFTIRSELIPQRELHHPRTGQQPSQVSKSAPDINLIEIRVRVNVKARGVRNVEHLPSKLERMVLASRSNEEVSRSREERVKVHDTPLVDHALARLEWPHR